MYLIDEDGKFTELRVGESQLITDSVFADDILKSQLRFWVI